MYKCCKKEEEWKVILLLTVLFIQDASFDNDISDLVGITIGRRSAVLKVAALCLSNISWDSD